VALSLSSSSDSIVDLCCTTSALHYLRTNPTQIKVLYKALTSAGITPGYRTHGFHMFRYSAGNIVHSKTRDVKTVQSLLGHSRIGTTADIYTQVEKVVGEEPSEALAKVIVSDNDVPLASDKIQ